MAGLSLVAVLIASRPLSAQTARHPVPGPGVPIIPPAVAAAQPPAAASPTIAVPQSATGTRHDRPIAAMHAARQSGWRQQTRYRRGWHRYRRYHRSWGGGGNRIAEQLNAEELKRVSTLPPPPSR